VSDFWRPTPRSRDEQTRERRALDWQWQSRQSEGWTNGFVGSLLVFLFIAGMCIALWIGQS
jgi:hypothetical protein